MRSESADKILILSDSPVPTKLLELHAETMREIFLAAKDVRQVRSRDAKFFCAHANSETLAPTLCPAENYRVFLRAAASNQKIGKPFRLLDFSKSDDARLHQMF